jgi:hypothetical protein
MTDPRVNELLKFAASEGINLPILPSLILWFEDRGCVVDLVTGKATRPAVGTPTPTGYAVAYLLREVVGEFAL